MQTMQLNLTTNSLDPVCYFNASRDGHHTIKETLHTFVHSSLKENVTEENHAHSDTKCHKLANWRIKTLKIDTLAIMILLQKKC
mmetsp:Transcript_3480/g.5026  ORF Transcript_3480/g.5026 Transcript_3480/m.5026 type:complete len:84 (+) Transcript_3480:153-404(+)